ncbi:MAG TPA: cation:proton antiporter [Nitrospiria bacterium]|jgi:CPA2 family monovalent cation:H+ antiporter-2
MEQEFTFLTDLIVVFFFSILVVTVFQRVRQPTIIGFLVTGILIGPYGLSLVDDVRQVEVLANIGVILLLFSVGIEVSIQQVSRIRKMVFLGGGFQVGVTILLVTIIFFLLKFTFQQALFIGFLLSLSSTAIVLKILMDRGELDAPHGRFSLGILLFQDLCIVPLMLVTPLLSDFTGDGWKAIPWALGKAALLIVLTLIGARYLIPWFLFQISRTKSRETFVIGVILLCLGTAWLTSKAGLSLALGAFIAGLVISESEFRHQVLAETLPFRDGLYSLFFISVGMLMDITFLIENWAEVLLWIGLILILKTLVAGAPAFLFRYSHRIAVLMGMALAQVGEFSFVLATVGLDQGIISAQIFQTFLSASIVTMILTPILIQMGPWVAEQADRFGSARGWIQPEISEKSPGDQPPPLKDHVVIVGYGINGRNLSRVLKVVKIPYIILELNSEVVKEYREVGEPIYYGDAAREEVLKSVGLTDAKVVVFAISDPSSILQMVTLSRRLNPPIHIIVRIRYVSEMDLLFKMGANEVIPEEFETSIEIFARVLRRFGIARPIIQQQVQEIRSERYEMFRGIPQSFHALLQIPEMMGKMDIETALLPEGAFANGKTLEGISLRKKAGASVIAVVREGVVRSNPSPGFLLKSGDQLVLFGEDESMEKVIHYLNSGEIDEIEKSDTD